ncbi:hypothetical protein [Pseudomonas sp. HY7a-MNA-CIBAN-0227]|uniref:hypothetical protein n=1 Tax=Pseudomonas sp. HY7a-MNA-CIBAN-0227 TaxID=3140474 RepID=UPI00332088A3
MDTNIIIILTLLASVIPLSIIMLVAGYKEAKKEFILRKNNAIESLNSVSSSSPSKTLLIEELKSRISKFELSKDYANLYLVEGKFNLSNSEISAILKSIK